MDDRAAEQAEGDAKLATRVFEVLLFVRQPTRSERLLHAVAENTGFEEKNDHDRMEKRVNRWVRYAMNFVAHFQDNFIQSAHVTSCFFELMTFLTF